MSRIGKRRTRTEVRRKGFLLVGVLALLSFLTGLVTADSDASDIQGAVDLGYYQALAREGSADAQLVLGDHFRSGADGIEQDLTEAYAWYYVAAQQGVEEAITPMIEVLLQLSPEQQRRAKKIAEDYAERFVP